MQTTQGPPFLYIPSTNPWNKSLSHPYLGTTLENLRFPVLFRAKDDIFTTTCKSSIRTNRQIETPARKGSLKDSATATWKL